MAADSGAEKDGEMKAEDKRERVDKVTRYGILIPSLSVSLIVSRHLPPPCPPLLSSV